MAVHQLISSLRQELFEKPDDVVNGWFMSNNPALIVGILSTYWMFVYKIGPNWMRDRKPYDPKALLQLYNIIQVVVCLGMVIWVSTYTGIDSYVLSIYNIRWKRKRRRRINLVPILQPFTDAAILKSVFSFGCSNCLTKGSDKYYAVSGQDVSLATELNLSLADKPLRLVVPDD